MPGAFAHLSLVGSLTESNLLKMATGFTPEAKAALLKATYFCDLGAVSPDYPYLDIINNNNAAGWADLMHYKKTGQMIKTGVEIVRQLKDSKRMKAFAWLLGYTAHVIADVTIHPVVEMKVGPYEQNKTLHRVCEMHQDAYIFPKTLNVGAVGLSEYLDSGIRLCSVPDNKHRLDPVISDVWHNMLKACHPGEYRENKPDMDSWHSAFIKTIDIAEESGSIFAAARHLAVSQGLTYPAEDEIDQQYIDNLQTHHGPMSYDAIFGRAKKNVLDIWSVVAAGIFSDDREYETKIIDWNLDTGKDAHGNLTFWSHQP